MDMINEAGKGEKMKYRLARSMKECMKTMSVDNITVKQITENCGVTRQTFYRNFMDKFDPVSYTHLDVYKRQGEGLTKNRRKNESQGNVNMYVCLLYTSQLLNSFRNST